VPSDLYHFLDRPEEEADLKVNGAAGRLDVEKGFARLRRSWKKGDPMAPSSSLNFGAIF